MQSSAKGPGPAEVVRAFFDHLLAGEPHAALQLWAPNSVWHVTGQSAWARDYSPAEYLAMGAQWYVKHPDYNYKMTTLRELGELAFFSIRSRGGEAPGEAEGMMVYRVVDGRIAEGWAIPASGGGRYTF
jgi:ketosteroid isomerase-like protein